jgi:hypothetical protein
MLEPTITIDCNYPELLQSFLYLMLAQTDLVN